MTATLLFVQAVAFAILSGIVASNKNRNPAGWGVLGFLFGLFSFIAVLVLEKVEPNEKQHSATTVSQPSKKRDFDPDEHDKKCPACAEYIKLEARICKDCGHEFSEREVEEMVDEVKREQKQTEGQSQSGTGRATESATSNRTPTPPNTHSTSHTSDTYAPDTSKTERWVITVVVFGGIIVLIFTAAILQAG